MSLERQQSAVTDEKRRPATSERRGQARKAAPKVVVLPQTLTVKRLAELTRISPIDAIKQLMRNGIMASMNQVIDFEVATLVTSAFGVRVKPEEERAAAPSTSALLKAFDGEIDASKLVVRSPVVTILGHVDHGKTTLLDTIRRSRVTDSEVGGITQHIGAYQVNYNGKEITFLDTPGHEAFTAIRARGARVTDIAVLVVAADDGMMPQTIEALDHAKAANVPVVVAINKMDRPDADSDKVKRQLAEQGLILEEWGGDVMATPISAIQGDGIDDLLENILVISEVSELKADPDRRATGVVIEAKLDKSRGALATVLVRNGTLRVGDPMIAGTSWGRIKAMTNDLGKRVKEVAPSVPAEVMGFDSLPEAGDVFQVLPDERTVRDIVVQRLREKELENSGGRALTLEEIYTRVKTGEVKELNLVIKADVQGSIEAVCSALERLESDRVKVSILHAGSGTITETDVLLASASKAIIIGFSTTTQQGVERLAEREGVEIRHYNIIYRLIEDVEKALKGILESTYTEVVQGHAEVRVTFSVGRRNRIAGCMVSDGRLTRGANVRVIRGGEVIHNGSISSIRHFKEEVNEITAGFECGIGLAGYTAFEEGDVLETYRRERVSA